MCPLVNLIVPALLKALSHPLAGREVGLQAAVFIPFWQRKKGGEKQILACPSKLNSYHSWPPVVPLGPLHRLLIFNLEYSFPSYPHFISSELSYLQEAFSVHLV